MIVICAREDDVHAVTVGSILESQHGEEVFIFDTSRFPGSVGLSGNFGSEAASISLNVHRNGRICLEDVKSFWWRRPQPMVVDPRIVEATARDFAYQECVSALYGAMGCCDALWVNDIDNDIAAEYKPVQLKVGARLGFQVPETLITNEPEKVTEFWEQHNRQVVFKAFNQRGLVWCPTRPLREQDMAMVGDVRHAPVIFQALVPGIRDVRVTVIGDRIFATEFDIERLESVDYRTHMAAIPCRPHTLPAELESKIRKLMSALGLEYGGIDFRLTRHAGYVFFEVNTAGEFMYLQERTRQPIAEAMAAHLAEGKATHSKRQPSGE